MQQKRIIISRDIFEKFPQFMRGIIFVKEIDIVEKNKRIKKPLNKIIEQRKTDRNNYEEHPFIKAWDEAHLKFGSNPDKHPPSIKALLTRAISGGGLPFINSVVALFNYISIKYLVPCGGDDLNMISGNLCLGFASGSELFTGLGSKEVEHPVAGEVIYYDTQSKQIMCRRWNWRNADFSKITTKSKKIVINIDGINGIPRSVISEARDELAELLKIHCDASLTAGLLDKDDREMLLSE